MNYPDDTFLARWMAGTLTEEEKAEFEKTEDFKQLRLLMDTMGEAEEHPFEHERVLAQIKEKQRKQGSLQSNKARSLRPLVYVLAVATIAVLLFFFWPSPNANISVQAYATTAGEQMDLSLSDGSRMQLNADSKAKVELADDLSLRKVSLEGEAYFEVSQKGPFAVETEQGLVEVLGTRFSVRERENGLEVQCFEGVVSVSLQANDKVDTLRAGEGIRKEGAGEVFRLRLEKNKLAPSWTAGVSQLSNLPLAQIIKEYERQFGVPLRLDSSLDANRILTVSFPHDDLKTALEIGLGSFGIEASFENDTIVRLKRR